MSLTVLQAGTYPRKLILSIHRAGIAVGRIGDGTNVGYERLNVGLAESVSPGRHERRLVECGATVADDGSEICVGDFVERVALGERMRLDFEIVEVRDALDR